MKENKKHLKEEDKAEKIAETPEGYWIYKKKNKLIGGYDFYSDSCGGIGHMIIDACTSLTELRAVVRYLEDEDIKAALKKDFEERNKIEIPE